MVSEHASPLATLGGVDAGGQNVHVAALATAIAGQGHEVTVYTRRDDGQLPERVSFAPGVTVVHVPAGPAEQIPKDDILPWIPQFGRWLGEQWAGDPPDIVHSHFWMSGLAALAGARDLGVPVVHTYHALGTVKRRHQGSDDTSPPQRINAETVIGRSVDAVIATCGDEVTELLRMKVPRRAACVVPCGVDTELFAPSPVTKPRRPRLLSLGRLVPRKGVDTVIEALRSIRDAELVVVGGPPADELDGDPEVIRLREEACRAGVAERVRFVGQVPREDVPALIRSAHVTICVPWYEPFGMVALEAMACGVPVVASAVGGQKETVVNGVTGILVPPRQPVALTRAVRRLLDDPLLCSAYGIAGADRARSRYAWTRIARETLAAYARVLAARSAERRAS
jgi:glycosyltransferase involved in cell wall biosynthesis